MTARRYGDVVMDNIDDLAIRFACQGTPMELNRDETVVALGRMFGKHPLHEIARRCRISERQICRLLNTLGAQRCPDCRQLTFTTNGVIDHHIDYHRGHTCGASQRRTHHELEVAS